MDHLSITVDRGDFVELAVSVWDAPLDIVVREQDGRVLVERFSPVTDVFGLQTFSFVSKTEGLVRVQLLTSEGKPPARFEVSVIDRHLATTRDDDRMRAASSLRTAIRAAENQQSEAALSAARTFAELCARSLWTGCMARADYLYASVYFHTGRYKEAIASFDRAVGHARALSDAALEASILVQAAACHEYVSEFSSAAEAGKEALRKSQTTSRLDLQADALMAICSASRTLGQSDDARTACEQALTIAERNGLTLTGAKAKIYISALNAFNGDSRADQYADEAIGKSPFFG
jgi:tetratricopeptide (TPR) repeat protein